MEQSSEVSRKPSRSKTAHVSGYSRFTSRTVIEGRMHRSKRNICSGALTRFACRRVANVRACHRKGLRERLSDFTGSVDVNAQPSPAPVGRAFHAAGEFTHTLPASPF